MKSQAAVLREQPGKWEIVEVDVEPPRQGELLVRLEAAGLCHSDDHVATGDLPIPGLPIAGGHEGAGIVDEVGPHTPEWKVGDRVILSFLPACGHCRWCASGRQNRCDSGVNIPALIELYRRGQLRLYELTTRRYTLGQVNEGYIDMRAGLNMRGVIELQH